MWKSNSKKINLPWIIIYVVEETISNAEDFLNTALTRQGLDLDNVPARLKETWSDGGYDYEVRIHEADSNYDKQGSIIGLQDVAKM